MRPRLFGLVVGVCVGLLWGVPAFAAGAGVQWSVSAVSRPTNFAPGGDVGGDAFVVLVTNTGSGASSGPVTITEELPVGLEAAPGVSAKDELGEAEGTAGHDFSSGCGADGEEREVSCTFGGVVEPDDTLIVSFPVRVSGSPPVSCVGGLPALAVSCVANVVRVSGGGGLSASVGTPTVISGVPAGFGVSPGGASSVLSSVQAGAHPDLTVSTAFNTENLEGATAGNLKNTTYDLPPGFAGDLVDTPACSAVEFLREECPLAAQVGVTTVDIIPFGPQLQPVYNLAPEPGEVGKIGFWVKSFFYEGDVKVRDPGESGPAGGPGEPYGLKTTFYNASAGIVEVDNVSLTVWGVPANPIHDALRWQPNTGSAANGHFGASSDATEAPYFTNPTSCGGGPLQASFSVTSWQHPSESPEATTMSFGPMVGCDALVMEPSLTAEVSTDKASAATGLNVDTIVPQTYGNPRGVATPTLSSEVVTLPEGMTVNPSAGAGLEACSEAQYAAEGAEYVAGAGCPPESKLATVRIKTPSLSEEVTGSVFLATPAPRGEAGENPFSSLLAVYLVARIADRGVLIKAPGEIAANAVTGQLTTTFDGLPALPFSTATFAFNQGANAPLVTPAVCGDYTVTAALTPSSNPAQILTPLVPPFVISSGFDGGACPAGGTPPFNPQVTAYPIHGNAGAYSPFYLRVSRDDGEQEITGFSSVLPPGLSANLNGVPFCSEAEIEAARVATGAQEEAGSSCPAGSEIGHSVAEAGVGTVLAQAPGKIFLAGPWEGAPFSIVSVTSAKVGPFDLGTVVVRFPLDINPETAVVSIPAGAADQIPHIIKGIVIHVRNIRVYIDRANFMLNPTSCNPLSFSATVIGSGQSFLNDPAGEVPVTVTDPFQAADCSSLKFAPKFSVSTSGKTSKALGASLTVHLTYPPNALTHDANIHLVKVELPKALPSRLTTLQKACTAAVFKANPANCPAASIIGHAKVVTPILPVPLEGPAYFVSNGGEAFPNLIMVLQGYGVTIELVGDTFISKSGITSSTFKSVPDEPVGSFELTLPEGPYSALAANGNLCAETKTTVTKKKVSKRVHGKLKKVTVTTKKTTAEKLTLPTEFIASNGAEVHQQTPVEVTGCPKAKKAVKKAKGKAKHKKK